MAQKKQQTIDWDPIWGLHVEIVGSGTILNNGVSNTLHVGITNNNLLPVLTKKQRNITFDDRCYINLFFVVDDKQTISKKDRIWALTSFDKFPKPKDLDIMLPFNPSSSKKTKNSNDTDTSNWSCTKTKEGTPNTLDYSLKGWKISRKKGNPLTLSPGETIIIQINNIKTNYPDGPTIPYYEFYGPGPVYDAYHQIIKGKTQIQKLKSSSFGPVYKTPNILRGQKVGIDKNSPLVSLDVDGGIRVKGGEPGANGSNNAGYFFNHPGDWDSGMSSSKQGQVEFYVNSREAVRIIDKDGTKVGIALFDAKPTAALHIGDYNKGKEVSLKIDGNNAIELGGNLKKGLDSGKIAYQFWSEGLDIVGAGDSMDERKITLYSEGGLNVQGSQTTTGDLSIKDGALNIDDGSGNAEIYAKSGIFLRSGDKFNHKEHIIVNWADGGYLGLFGTQRFDNNKAPVIYKTFDNLPNPTTHDTKISSKEYVAILGGYKVNNYDLREFGGQNWELQLIDKDGTWQISINMPYNGNTSGFLWSVNLMAIHRNLTWDGVKT
ncbi:MAG: hypothetical protein DWQ02_10950 [Bacteroidetes bacterium]|nr:MAG: hypothetical protein DWQ02_10950 [Bacteroidota bacterium]